MEIKRATHTFCTNLYITLSVRVFTRHGFLCDSLPDICDPFSAFLFSLGLFNLSAKNIRQDKPVFAKITSTEKSRLALHFHWNSKLKMMSFQVVTHLLTGCANFVSLGNLPPFYTEIYIYILYIYYCYTSAL